MKPYLALPIIVVGIESNGAKEHAGLVTRVWADNDLDEKSVMVNCVVFPDMNSVSGHGRIALPAATQGSIQLFATRDQAVAFRDGQASYTPMVAYVAG